MRKAILIILLLTCAIPVYAEAGVSRYVCVDTYRSDSEYKSDTRSSKDIARQKFQMWLNSSKREIKIRLKGKDDNEPADVYSCSPDLGFSTLICTGTDLPVEIKSFRFNPSSESQQYFWMEGGHALMEGVGPPEDRRQKEEVLLKTSVGICVDWDLCREFPQTLKICREYGDLK